jgi:hypothetical protein
MVRRVGQALAWVSFAILLSAGAFALAYAAFRAFPSLAG